MTEGEFRDILIECGSRVADQFYPKGENPRRGEFLRDLGLLGISLTTRLTEAGVIEEDARG